MAGRIIAPFSELFEIPLRNGLTRPKAIRGKGIKMVNMGEVFAHRRIRDLDMDRVPMHAKERDSGLLCEGDLLFARQSLVFSGAGKCVLFQGDKDEVTFESHIIRCRLNRRKADPAFYFYLFESSQGRSLIESIVEQVAAAGIRGSDLGRLTVPVPPLAEQKAIAAVLGALDDKIELNRRMNATLEAMARALFQSWFVDFDPVRAKMDGREPVGMDPETAALFPDRLEDSPLGHIPKGWSARCLPEAIDVNPRRSLKGGTIAPYLDMKNLPTQGHFAEDVIDREFSSGAKFQNGDTLLARITPCLQNGKTGYVDFLADAQVGWGSTEFIVFAPKPPLPPQFGYLLARSDALRTHAIQNMSGTSGRQRVPSECFNTFWLAIPPPPIAERFDELTAPLMAKIKSNADQSRTLATSRDTLFPGLISGKLSLPIMQ